MPHPAPRGCVLITGASSGIGRACVQLLANRGYKVFAGVRTTDSGRDLQKQHPGITPLCFDITQEEQIRNALQKVEENLPAPWSLTALVNNAGSVLGGPLEFLPIQLVRGQLEVNVISHVAVTQAFLPLLRRSGGRILFMGSPSGFFAPPFLGPYAVCKFALEALCDALRRELRAQGIRVILVEPGAVKTAVWDKSMALQHDLEQRLSPEAKQLYGARMRAGRILMERLKIRAMDPYRVARVVQKALEAQHPKARYLVGLDAIGQRLAARLVPDRILDALTDRALRHIETRQPGTRG